MTSTTDSVTLTNDEVANLRDALEFHAKAARHDSTVYAEDDPMHAYLEGKTVGLDNALRLVNHYLERAGR